jgi:hypothetical protein
MNEHLLQWKMAEYFSNDEWLSSFLHEEWLSTMARRNGWTPYHVEWLSTVAIEKWLSIVAKMIEFTLAKWLREKSQECVTKWLSSLLQNGLVRYSKMTDNIVKWLNNYEKWLSHVERAGSIGSIRARWLGLSAWSRLAWFEARRRERPPSCTGLARGADQLARGMEAHVGGNRSRACEWESVGHALWLDRWTVS